MTCDFSILAAPGVVGLHPYQPGKPVEELEREYGVAEAIKLASNENPAGPGRLALAAVEEATKSLGRYPDGNGYILKRALSEKLGLGMEHITLGNGSNEILELVARTFVTPGDQVVFSEFAFAVYPIVTQAVGAEAVVVSASNRGHDLQAMCNAVTDRTRLVFIANPNNPTGTWISSADLRAFLEAVPPTVLVVVDEAYFEYVGEADYPDSVKWLDLFPNLLVTRTFSKIHGLAGLRIGYGLSHPEIAELMNRVRQPFNINAVALAAAAAALTDEVHIAASRERNQVGMQQLTAAFDTMGLAYIPSVGNFVCVDPGRPGGEIFEALLQEGVIVRPLANYGLPSFLRVTTGYEMENSRFIAALDRVLGKSID